MTKTTYNNNLFSRSRRNGAVKTIQKNMSRGFAAKAFLLPATAFKGHEQTETFRVPVAFANTAH